jgi:hypothetical protein
LYGTWISLMPTSFASNLAAICETAAVPDEAYLIWRGSFFALLISSWTEYIPADGCTTRTLGVVIATPPA